MMRRSQRVFEPQAAPLCATFEDAGVAGALARLRDALALGASFVNIHQGTRANPWINYPLDSVASLQTWTHATRATLRSTNRRAGAQRNGLS